MPPLRPLSSYEATVLGLAHYESWARVVIEAPDGDYTGGTVVQDRLVTWAIDADLDRPTITGNFKFHLGLGADSYSPYVAAGVKVSGSIPLFEPGNLIRLEVLCVAPGEYGAHSTEWRRLWHGIIDDADPASDGSDLLTVLGRCQMGRWVDKQIEVLTTTTDGQNFGFTVPALTDGVAIGYIQTQAWTGDPDTLHTYNVIGADPPLANDAFWQEGKVSLYSAMQKFSVQAGYDLRGRWQSSILTGESYAMILYDPERDRVTPDWTFPANIIDRVRNLPISRRNIRNRCYVTPADTARVPAMAEDTVSQGQYRLNTMFISEDKSSLIIDATQAAALAAFAVSDLAQPKASLEAERGLFWPIQINELVEFGANGVHIDSATMLAVSGFTHTGDAEGHASTALRTRKFPAAANKYWRDQMAKKQYTATIPPVGGAAEDAVWDQVDDLTPP